MIVEDEIIIGLDVARRLGKLGYQVTETATRPDQALESIKIDKPDLIMMDINLKSDIDGVELAAMIRKDNDIPVIYMTSYSDGSMIDRAIQTEPYGYIIKPYTDGMLIASLRTAFARKELENKNRSQHEMLQGVMDNISDSIVLIRGSGEIIRTNSRFSELVGADNLVGKNIEDVLGGSPDIETLHNIGSSRSGEMFTAKIGGAEKSILIHTSDFVWEGRKSTLLTITDLTEIIAVRSALSDAEQRFTKIFRKKMIPAVLVSCEGMRLFEMNDAFAQLYKVSQDVEADISISEYIGSEALKAVEQSMDADKSFRVDMIRQKDKEGREFFANFRGKRVEFDSASFFLFDVHDVTEQVRISEMERELQQKLIHANKMTSLGTLVSGVAHEINNPNNFIMFNSSLLVDFWSDIFDHLDDKTPGQSIGNMTLAEFRSDIEELMHGIINGSERIKNIVQDLKGFAKTESSGYSERLNIENTLRTSVRILEHQISKTTGNFIMDIAPGLPDVNGNEQKLEQVFINILMNALEAVASGDSLVEVKCYPSAGKVVVDFTDKGVGIPSDHLDRITEPFFTTRQNCGGTGLGLSIAYAIIKEHKGVIDISSTPGEGTCVRIQLPGCE